VDNSTVVCFESHLITELGLLPSKFLVSILNFLGCELVHLNLNAIVALSCFTMLCECWLGIAPDISLFCTSIPPPDTIKLSIPGSGYRCVAIARKITLMHPSKVAGGVPLRDGF
jgi:hypothetical protein